MEEDEMTKNMVAVFGCLGLLILIAMIVFEIIIFFAVIFKGDVQYDSGLVAIIIFFGGWFNYMVLKSVLKSAFNFYIQYFTEKNDGDD